MILPVPVYVAAGGRSSRFGSDKARARLPLHSTPESAPATERDTPPEPDTPSAEGPMLIEAVIEALRPIAADVTLVADRTDRFADLGLPTILDVHPGLGPISGLEAALRARAARTCDDTGDDRPAHGWLFFVSCDLAGLKPGWVELLAHAVEQHGGQRSVGEQKPLAAAFCRPDDGPRRWDPLFALYHTEALPHVEHAIARGQFAMWRLLENLAAIAVPHPTDWEDAIAINTPADLQTFIERSGGTIQST